MKVDPIAMDRIWKSRIEKEEKAFEKEMAKQNGTEYKPPQKVVLNAMSTAQVTTAAAAESHLLGGGALVKPKDKAGLDALGAEKVVAASGGGSVASCKMSTAGSAATGSVAGSAKTSIAKTGTSARTTDTQMLRRLEMLETELAEERQRRIHVQQEMQAMLAAANAQPPSQS